MPDMVQTQQHGAVLRVTLNRPEKRNALNIPMLDALCTALDAAEQDAAIRAVVLQATGPVFCAGLDLAEAQDAELAHRSAMLVRDALRTLYRCSKATIARIQGAAMAGGAGLMSACDIVVAADNARFGYPEVRRGLVAGLVATLLRRQLSERHVRELMLVGEAISAERAFAMGLVTRIAPEPQLDGTVDACLQQILLGAPVAIRESKALIEALWPRDIDGDFDRALDLHVSIRTGDEALEGMRAFTEKRKPSWQE